MTSAIQEPTATEPPEAHRRSSLPLQAALFATCGALALNLLIFAIAKAGGVDFEIPTFGSGKSDPMTVNTVQVVVSTLVGLGVGWLVAAAAARIGRPSLRAVAVSGGMAAVISCGAPLTLDASGGVRTSLTLMHLAAGAVFVWVLLNTGEVER